MRHASLALFTILLAVVLVGCQKDRPSPMSPQTPQSHQRGVATNVGGPVERALGDRVWHDVNRDGLLLDDNIEPGIEGIVVEAYTCAGTFVARDTTDAWGFYEFDNLPVGDYKIRFIIPPGWRASPQDQGSDDEVDSDANPVDGWTVCTSLGASEFDWSWDMGLYEAPRGFHRRPGLARRRS